MAIAWPAPEVQWAILLCMATPIVLLLSRWLPLGFAHRFNATAAIVLGSYVLGCISGVAGPTQVRSIITGAAFVVSALIFALGFWGVLTRGYSVALLIALNRLGGRARVIDLENAYSGDRGLLWLAHKRLSGLTAARVVTINTSYVAITRSVGSFVLCCYTVFRSCFRLKDYG